MVDAGDCYSGGKESNHHRAQKLNTRRGTVRKVAGTEAKGTTASEVLVEVMGHADERSLTSIVSSEAQSGATVFTNEWQAYNRLRKMGYKHRSVARIAGQQMDGMARPSGFGAAWASIERWDQRTSPNMSSEHVNHCVNRLKGRNNIRAMKLGGRTARQMEDERLTHRELVANELREKSMREAAI
ncbi:transposase [Candidatus Poriferisocius sp.]|uniref:transposase n=1 Tax=Candidatus Poriferisocius sp. TaxID=3101276 RepID=UPI003B0276F0